jgi:acetamidase/formamidase/AraC-like DNA-binding protein
MLAGLGVASHVSARAGSLAVDHLAVSRSVRGSVFVNLRATAQVLAPSIGASSSTVLVLGLLEGTASMLDTASPMNLVAGDILLLDLSQPWQLHIHDHFQAMFIRLESAAFLQRLMRTGGREANRIQTRQGLGALCHQQLLFLAAQLQHLESNELPVLEATLSELLVACLSGKQPEAHDDSTGVQLAHLRRVCRTIDSRLSDPSLRLECIARQEGLSPRYVQKLFRNSGTSFSDYLKGRRIQNCCLDLANPSLSQISIAELCYRWGFNDPANFSRTFSQQMGVSPRAYRAAPPRDIHEQLRRGRPDEADLLKTRQPDGLHADTRKLPKTVDISNHRRPFRDVLDEHARYAMLLRLAPKRVHPLIEDPVRVARQYYLPASDKTVHWGYFSRDLKPVLTIRSGDVVTIETLTQHASDDWTRMVANDPGAESVFHWTKEEKKVDRRGAGPMDASICGRGAGEGFGVHICTGPVYISDAEPGDVLEIRIVDIRPRPSNHPDHLGRCYGSNAASWWGFHYDDLLTEPKKREVVTIYEVHHETHPPHAKAVYNFRWTPQTDPFGTIHERIDYPGVPVDHQTVEKRYGILDKARVPVRPHFGVMAVAPSTAGLVDSIPPSHFGGNLDNWRAGKGSKLFLPVGVKGALFSVGDPHASQGDSELCGTAIECSLTGVFQFILHKQADIAGKFLGELNYPFLETPDEWVLQGLSFADYQAELGPGAQTQVYKDASLESAMRDAFRKTRHYLMTEHQLSEDEAISIISVAVDFGVTQIVDGNLGIHAIIKKTVFPDFAG